MKYKTIPSGRPSDYYMFGLIFGGIAFWILTNYQKSFAALFQLISLSMFALALFILIRYRLTVFCLRIEGKNGAAVDIRTAMAEELDFVVERMHGKSSVALARLSLAELKRAEVVKYDKLKECTVGMSLYKYQANMSPDEGVLLVFGNTEYDIAIFTDISADMLAFLKITVDSNRSFQ